MITSSHKGSQELSGWDERVNWRDAHNALWKDDRTPGHTVGAISLCSGSSLSLQQAPK